MQKNIDDAGVETLNSSDKLYVVHVKQQTKDKDRAWSAGGPLLPGLEMALARYPHTIVELEVCACATSHIWASWYSSQSANNADHQETC